MKKIPTLFMKDQSNKYCKPVFKVQPARDMLPLRKFDGTAMFLSQSGQWYHRRSFKGQTPGNFIRCTLDKYSGKTFGWVPVTADFSYFKMFEEALDQEPYDLHLSPGSREPVYEFGTYELIGEKINRNAESVEGHRLMPHRRAPQVSNVSQLDLHTLKPKEAYDALKMTLEYMPIEGVVFWTPGDAMQAGQIKKIYKPYAKIRRKDFDFS